MLFTTCGLFLLWIFEIHNGNPQARKSDDDFFYRQKIKNLTKLLWD